MASKSTTIVLKEYFGLKPGQSLKEFREEVKQLSESARLELANLAADALGLTDDDRMFGPPLAAA